MDRRGIEGRGRDGVMMMMMVMMMVMMIHLPHATSLQVGPARVCVGEGVDCSRLGEVSGGVLACIHARDRLDCLKMIRDGEADIGYFDAEDINLAALSFWDDFEAVIEAARGDEVRQVFLLVNNASNPNPSSLCHPGYNPHLYYPTALHRPTTTTSHVPPQNIKSHMQELSQVWSSACIPGAWSQDPVTDRQLKQQYPQLCSRCLRQSCSSDDPYTGSGALQCLLDHAAEAAIVSDVDLRNARARNAEVENLYHYCGDTGGGGFTRPLADRTSGEEEPCDWGRRPLPVLMFPPCNDTDCYSLRELWVRSITSHSREVLEVLELPEDVKFTSLAQPLTPSEIIKRAGYKVRATPIKKPVKFCVHKDEELEKCEDLVLAARGYGIEGGIGLGCHLAHNASHCFANLYFGKADVVTLDGGDVYQVTKDYGFERVLSEVYQTQSSVATSNYYAVAVVRADSNITAFSHLKDRKSCHTGIGKTAGWKLPVATLLQLGLIEPQHCNYVKAMAEFFTGGSCAPGAKIPKYNKQNNYVSRLCSLCVGAEQENCARSSDEPFYSYTGAFRCLVHGGGDVAFVKHTTVPDNTDGANTESWATDLRSEDYKLLCPSHGGASTAAVTEYSTCNLALVPAHEVVVGGEMSEMRKRQVRQVLLGVAEVFKPGTAGSNTFRLFGSYKGKTDLLFKDSAKGLKALTEDTRDEMQRKHAYYNKLDELHSCEVRVCALEGQEDQCESMASLMSEMGQRFVCVSARDRLDCVRRVVKGHVDMTSLPGNYLQVSPDLRIIAYSRDPYYSEDYFRYRAVMVVRRSTVRRVSDLRGKKACHTGYGRTTGWRIPVALLKREGVIQPLCGPHQSSLEHEISSMAVTFNRACVPGEWATTNDTDAALKRRFSALCSMCSSGTCDKGDDYAGYEGALRCLTQKGGDVAFSKLTVVQDFFVDNRAVNMSEYALLCRDGSIVDITSPAALNCYWAARPWNTFVTHGGASDGKIQKLLWALTQAKWKAEEDLDNRQWYFNTLGIDDSFNDLLPDLDNKTTGEYYEESRMNIVEAERMCSDEVEEPVRFCVTSDEEYRKCGDLSAMLRLRGVAPDLSCERKNDVDQCISSIDNDYADVMTLNDTQQYRAVTQDGLTEILSETYASSEANRYYFVGVIKQNSTISSIRDIEGKTTCNVPQSTISTSDNDTIDSELSNCLGTSGHFFHTYKDAFMCLLGANKDIAFVKHDIDTDGGLDQLKTRFLNPTNFALVCEGRTMPVTSYNVRECNLGQVPADVVVTRHSESGARKEDMRHVLLKAVQLFGKSNSFFRLFYDYYSNKNLLFRDDTIKLIPIEDDHEDTQTGGVGTQPCDLYLHHLHNT